MKALILMIILAATSSGIVLANELPVSRFTEEGLTGWEIKEFKGITEYRLVKSGGQTVVKAHSHGTASGLFKKIKLDPVQYRYLRWSWKIIDTIRNGDENTKAGDDYAARVYVVFPGRFFWQARAINYIWANRMPKGASLPNVFSNSAMMVAVESGPEHAGQWLSEERDILADYRRLFGEEPGKIGAIAIMTDTDNTGGEATAWYGEISISSDR